MLKMSKLIFMLCLLACIHSQTIQLSTPQDNITSNSINSSQSNGNSTQIAFDANALAQLSKTIDDILASLNKTDSNSTTPKVSDVPVSPSSQTNSSELDLSPKQSTPDANSSITQNVEQKQLTKIMDNLALQDNSQLSNQAASQSTYQSKAADEANLTQIANNQPTVNQSKEQSNSSQISQTNSASSQAYSSSNASQVQNIAITTAITTQSINQNQKVQNITQTSPILNNTQSSNTTDSNSSNNTFLLCKTDADCLYFGSYSQLTITCDAGLCIIK